MDDEEEVLEKIIDNIIKERIPDLSSISGNVDLVSLIEVVFLMKRDVPFEESFKMELQKKLINEFFKEEKAKNTKFSFLKDMFSSLLLILGFPYATSISEEFTFGKVSNITGNGNLHYSNFKYNYIGFSCLPLISQNILK